MGVAIDTHRGKSYASRYTMHTNPVSPRRSANTIGICSSSCRINSGACTDSQKSPSESIRCSAYRCHTGARSSPANDIDTGTRSSPLKRSSGSIRRAAVSDHTVSRCRPTGTLRA